MIETIIKNFKENEIASVERSIYYGKQKVQNKEMTEAEYKNYLRMLFQQTLESVLGTKFDIAIPN